MLSWQINGATTKRALRALMNEGIVETKGRLAQDPMQKRSALGGLLIRRNRWGLSLPAKLLIVLIGLALAVTALLGVYPFLAITQPVDADTLVVEGWVHPYAIRAGAEEFNSHSYQRVFTSGGPVVGKGGYINDYQTSASVGADLLKEAGRTYSSAIALKDWFREYDVRINGLNIVTEGAHARRTRLLFAKALGADVSVGVIAVPNPDYDARYWWRYSEGVEEVIGESVAYIYARFFFHPSKIGHGGKALLQK
ncbi:MAG: hypothetical protein DMF40_16610 [Verrucomicrobia bacterium]|nr:MAG: hypothetical protein DMF40_16610 [Verrucomicrobiota bacterium]